jgi:hypothetical protein
MPTNLRLAIYARLWICAFVPSFCAAKAFGRTLPYSLKACLISALFNAPGTMTACLARGVANTWKGVAWSATPFHQLGSVSAVFA